MRRFSANYIYTNNGNPIRNGIVGVNDRGVIVEIIDHKGQEKEWAHTEFRNGIIVPGFVNAHCHTELSHLKGRIEPETGLADFVSQIRNVRLAGEVMEGRPIVDAIADLHRHGTIAVADICNTTDSFSAKSNSKIRFANLIEVLGIDPHKADQIIEKLRVIQQLGNQQPSCGCFLTPHSVYSLSSKLWEILSLAMDDNQIVSIHFAESREEELFTQNRTGSIYQNYTRWGLPVGEAPKGNPVDIVKKYIPRKARILFVHNTFLEKQQAIELSTFYSNSTFVLCPSSNLYIEKTLPNVPMFMELGLQIALGTDSLASSPTLSVLDQMQILLNNFPQIPFTSILEWATINGAKALGLDKEIGSIELGKSPGLNLITPFDFAAGKPKRNSRVLRLV